MEQSLNGVLRPSSPNARCGERRQASPDMLLMLLGRSSRRAEAAYILPLTVIRRMVAAIRLWSWRARSRQELRELDDHMLKDIGLRREDVGYWFPTRVWYFD